MWWILVSENGIWIDNDKEYLEGIAEKKLHCKYVIVPLNVISKEIDELRRN